MWRARGRTSPSGCFARNPRSGSGCGPTSHTMARSWGVGSPAGLTTVDPNSLCDAARHQNAQRERSPSCSPTSKARPGFGKISPTGWRTHCSATMRSCARRLRCVADTSSRPRGRDGRWPWTRVRLVGHQRSEQAVTRDSCFGFRRGAGPRLTRPGAPTLRAGHRSRGPAPSHAIP